MYFDLANGDRSYFASLPSWIQESVELTLEKVDLEAFRSQLTWTREYVPEGERIGYFHANPFGVTDWSYLNASDEHTRACEVLAERGIRLGVVGHTHRARWYLFGDQPSATTEVSFDQPYVVPTGTVVIANAGAIGQPRDRRGAAGILRVDVHDSDSKRITGRFERIAYKVEDHVAALHASGLKPTSIDKLVSFFRRSASSEPVTS
jgi:hypothetical protein